MIAKWDPYTILVLAESDGKTKFTDIIEDITINTVFDEETGISQSFVTDFSNISSRAFLRPSIIIENGEKADENIGMNLVLNL